MIHINEDHPKRLIQIHSRDRIRSRDCAVADWNGVDHRRTHTQCFLLNTLDQPLNRYWSVCLPQCVYCTVVDDDDEVFFLLGIEAVDADDMVEVTEFDESFLLITPRMAQPSVEVADRGVCCGCQSWCRSNNLSCRKGMLRRLGTHALGCGGRRRCHCVVTGAQRVQRR